MNAMTDTIEAEAALASPTDTAIDVVTVTQQETLESIETASVAVLTGVGQVQREIAGFVSARMRQDLEAQRDMLRCKSLGEVRDIQTRFLRSAVDQYSTEANKLLKLGGEILKKSLDRGA